MPSPTAENLASRLRQVRQSSRAQRATVDASARELIVVAFGVPLLALLVILAVVVAVLLLAGGGFAGFAATLGAAWLGVHQVPVTITGVTIGVLPLLPTLLIACATARMAAGASGPERPRSELLAVFFSAIGGPMLVTALSLAVVMDGSSVSQIQSPMALTAFGYTLGIHAAAAAGGIVWQRRDELGGRLTITPADRRGMRLGLAAAVALLTVGAVVVLLRLLLHWQVVGDVLATGNDFDGYLGLTALSVLYLPNVIVGATSVVLGADAHVGATSVNLTEVHAGPFPPLPVLGVLPESGAGVWGYAGLLVPLAISLVVALRCRNVDPLVNIRSVGVAGAVAASIMVMLSLLSGGALGEFGAVGVTVPTVGVFTLGWIVVVGLVVALIYGSLPSTRAARDAAYADGYDDYDTYEDDGYEDDYVTDEYDDAYFDEYEYEYDADGEYYDDADSDDDYEYEYDSEDVEYDDEVGTDADDSYGDDTWDDAESDTDSLAGRRN